MNLYQGVNALLTSIGEIPIDSDEQLLTLDPLTDVGQAKTTLLAMSTSIQQEGYWFNKDLQYPLVPTTNGYIPIGNSILNVVSPLYIVKDHKLYDTAKRTFLFDAPVSVDIVFNISFDDLPPVVADVIVKEAAVAFYNNVFGDTQESEVLKQHAARAQISFQKAHMKHRRPNMMKASRLLDRGRNPQGLR